MLIAFVIPYVRLPASPIITTNASQTTLAQRLRHQALNPVGDL